MTKGFQIGCWLVQAICVAILYFLLCVLLSGFITGLPMNDIGKGAVGLFFGVPGFFSLKLVLLKKANFLWASMLLILSILAWSPLLVIGGLLKTLASKIPLAYISIPLRQNAN